MKKLGVLVLIALLSLNLFGCGGKNAKEEPQTEAAVEEKEEQKKEAQETKGKETQKVETQTEEPKEVETTEAEVADKEEAVLLDTENVKITYASSMICNWDIENEFSFYFDVENRMEKELTITATEFVLDGYTIWSGYLSFAAEASSTTNDFIGYADHDYQGEPEYNEWLKQESEKGVRELNITLAVTDEDGNQIEEPLSVIIDVKNGTVIK